LLPDARLHNASYRSPMFEAAAHPNPLLFRRGSAAMPILWSSLAFGNAPPGMDGGGLCPLQTVVIRPLFW
jgi:hypothetical protein